MDRSKKFFSMIKIVIFVFLIVLLLTVVFFYYVGLEPREYNSQSKTLDDGQLNERLDGYLDNIISGGPPPDGIPPIEKPKYMTMDEADNFLKEEDVVFLANFNNEVFIYPQKILVWHEIVNEEINGEKVSITYCPLTGSAIGFKGKLSVGETTFGTSGKLLNSNLVMYDRKTNSYFPQILGRAISGESKGEKLERFPVIFTRWKNVKKVYDKAKVLSKDTGYIRNYEQDPYGSYLTKGDYYDSGEPIFPVMNGDARLADKEVVIAGRINQIAFAVVKKAVKEKGSIDFEIGGKKLKANYDRNLDAVTIFDNKGDVVNAFDVMWFGWIAFEPETKLIQ